MSNKKRIVICHDLDGKQYKVAADKLQFRPAIYGIIIQKDRILLSRQWDGYDFPGGGIDLGETLEEALIREVWEETGLKVAMKDFVMCEESFFKMPFNRGYVHSHHFYYLCKVVGGELSTENFDKDEKDYASMAEWVDLKKIPRLKFYSSIDNKRVLKKSTSLIKQKGTGMKKA